MCRVVKEGPRSTRGWDIAGSVKITLFFPLLYCFFSLVRMHILKGIQRELYAHKAEGGERELELWVHIHAVLILVKRGWTSALRRGSIEWPG